MMRSRMNYVAMNQKGEKARKKKQRVIVIFRDLEKPYDRVNIEAI